MTAMFLCVSKKNIMLNRHYQIEGGILLKLATIAALTIAYLCSGCEVKKHFSATKADTTSVQSAAVIIDKKDEATSIKSEDNKSHEENEWTRLTLKYLSEIDHGDTTINHYITQPATIIYERGKEQRDEQTKSFDSSSYRSFINALAISTDSMNRKIDNYEKAKHSETKGLSWVTIMMIVCGVIVLNKILVRLPFRMSSKQ
jgi:hypothetical protein